MRTTVNIIKARYTIGYFVITFFSLVAVFILRTLIIYYFNLELSVFLDFLYVGLVASLLRPLISVLFENLGFVPLTMSNVGSGAGGNPTGLPVGNPVGNPAANTGSANPPAANPGPANPPAVANPTGPGTFSTVGCDGGMGNSNWGPMNQQPAGRNTTPLVIYGSGTAYNPNGGNQPFANNLANALAFQSDNFPHFSRHVLNSSDLNFLDRYIYHNDRALHQRFTTSNSNQPYNWDVLKNNFRLRDSLRGLI